MQFSSLLSKCFLSILLICICGSHARAAHEPVLPPVYAHWLHEEVTYLITDDERQLFLRLKTDEDRDRFIQTFWRARNPNPNAPENAARQTYYQRLEYANSNFGHNGSREGWRSDRGMVYITLGAPKQIQKYHETAELKPIEIWFYESAGGILPTYFYVLFYRQSAAEDYELYSPYGDRPQKLVNSTNAVNDDKTAIKLIQRDINDEAAHVAISLIPGEPVDFKNVSPSLQSDVLLNDIRNYRNLPEVRELVATGRAGAEAVSHRVVLNVQSSDLTVIATRNGQSQGDIDYLLRLLRPEDFSLAQQQDGRHYYSLRLEIKLVNATGKVLLDRRQALSDYVPEKSYSDLQGKCLGLEGRLSASPGRYDLKLELTNVVTEQKFEQTRTVLVPGDEHEIGVSQLFFANDSPPQRSDSAQAPFTFSGVRLRPIGSDRLQIVQGQPLRTVFQIWAQAASPQALSGKTLHIHYLIGRPDSSTRIEEDQQVDRGSFTPQGNLLMGKDLRTEALVQGQYRLVVKVTEPESNAVTYQSLGFEVQDTSRPRTSLWTLDVPSAGK